MFHTYAATKNDKEKKALGHVANATLKNTKKTKKDFKAQIEHRT